MKCDGRSTYHRVLCCIVLAWSVCSSSQTSAVVAAGATAAAAVPSSSSSTDSGFETSNVVQSPVVVRHAFPAGLNTHAADTFVFRVMPLGDSISICCNYCAVPAGVLTKRELHEPPTPWDGYIRKLWLRLKEEELLQQADHRRGPSNQFRFTYVGRVKTCMVNRSETMRVPDDWEVRYEGYYGYTTGRVLNEIVRPALEANDPDIVLMMLGTNDLIQARSGVRGSRVGSAISNLKRLIHVLLTTPRADPANHMSRHVFIGKIPPIWFNQIKAIPPSGRKPHRVTSLNNEIEKMVTSMVELQKRRFEQIPTSVARGQFIPTLHVVDMFSNFSVTQDLHGDGLHPNAFGESKISTRWFRALAPLMDAPLPFARVHAAQNDDTLLQRLEESGNGTRGASGHKLRLLGGGVDALDQHSPLFGEPPAMTIDVALVPVVLITVLVYVAVVCRPTQRWIRQAYHNIVLLLRSGSRKPQPI